MFLPLVPVHTIGAAGGGRSSAAVLSPPWFALLESSMRRFAPSGSLSLLALLPMTAALVACPPKAAETSAVSGAGRINEGAGADGLIEQSVDINGDGKPDVRNYYRDRVDGPRLLVRRTSDLNWDGKNDVSSWFNEQTGQLEKEEMDADFDGRVDWVDHYQGGKRALSEVDDDNDGRFDLYKIFENGKVRRKERDTNGDGRIDLWEYMDEKGAVIKVGRDTDNDGVMDVRQD